MVLKLSLQGLLLILRLWLLSPSTPSQGRWGRGELGARSPGHSQTWPWHLIMGELCQPKRNIGALPPAPQNVAVGGTVVFTKVTKLNEATGAGPNPIGQMSLQEEMRTDAQRDDHVRTRGEDSVCKPRREALGGTRPVITMISASSLQTVRHNFCCFRPPPRRPRLWYCHSSPSKGMYFF